MKPVVKRNLFIAAVFVAATVIISFFLPREKSVGLDFVEGKPWKYEQLTSPFSFAVYKSEQALQKERAEVLSAQRPYYMLEDNRETEAVDSFNTACRRELYVLVGPQLRQKVNQKIQEVYANGIIGSSDLARLRADSITTIMLVKNQACG